MSLRQIIILALGLLFLFLCFRIAKGLIDAKPEPPKVVPKAARKLVRTMVATNSELRPQTFFLGKVIARNRMEVFAEVNGRLLAGGKEFREGTLFRSGESILRLDDEEQRMALYAQKTAFINAVGNILPDLKLDFPESFPRWEAYALSLNEQAALPAMPEPATDQERLFLSSRNITNQYYTIKSAESRLEKYRIPAPFDGVVAQALVNPGALVRAGQKMGEFIGEGSFEVEGAISFSELDFVKIGDEVNFSSREVSGSWTGRVIRISEFLDPTTQTVNIYCSVSGSGLKDGMYLDGVVQSDAVQNCIRLNRDLVLGDTLVFALKDSVLDAIRVELIKKGEKTALIRGVPDGALLLREPVNNAYSGMPVTPDR